MRTRLLLVMVGVVAIVLIVHDVPLARHLERVERNRLTTGLERDAFILAGRAEEALEDGTVGADSGVRAIVSRFNAEEGVRVAIVDADLVGVLGSDADVSDEDYSNRPEMVQALSGIPDIGERYSETLGEDLFYVAVPVLSGDEVVGVVRLTAPERVVADRVDSKVRGLSVVAGISLLIAVAVAWLFARSVTRPLDDLESATKQLADGDLDARADPTEGPGEIRGLAESFNSMASRLQRLVDRQRSFAGDASHQLRTPLTALRLRLEQAAASVDESSPASVPIEEALNETERLRRMIEGLLTLTRAEGAASAVVEVVDVAAIVRDRAEHWRPLAQEGWVQIDVESPVSAPALAVSGAVEQIVDNLVDNALEVSPEGSTVRVVVRSEAGSVAVHVIDAGAGLAPDEREQAFERFWRADSATTDGSGLGLAIVQQLATAGDGTAELREAAGGGLDAVVSFRSP
jgi:signal transduction histidine kinase